ncbi:MMPL family transporter [Microbacterium sp. bgisy207]|uniref:MMPL family transporter n=1 Tax=Microbacterium sp. bgisy207 TaxID=3413800 RepID=UPI003EB7F4E3
MSSFLYRVGRFAARRRWTVILVWLAVVVGASALAGALGNHLQSSFTVPGTQAQSALDALEQRFPQISGASAKVVVAAPSGEDVSTSQDLVVAACEDIAALEDVVAVTCPYPMAASGSTAASDGAASQISANGDMAFISVQLSVAATDIPDTLVSSVSAATEPLANAGLTVAVSGLAASSSSGVDWTELIGMGVAYLVLAITFGSLIAAGIPLVTAALGVGLSASAITIVAALAPVSSTAPVLATMLGLAVGIDYALLITSRHRDNLREGMDPAESVAVAIATAGTAVVFAGMTVMIALVGLGVAGIPFLTVMGLGAAGAVLTALLVAVTLLPAILSLLGHRLVPRGRAARHGTAPVRTARWVKIVTAQPLLTAIGVAAALAVLAIPASGLRLTLPDAGYDPPGSEARVAYDLLDTGFGPGFNGPLLVTADISRTLQIEQALDALDDAFQNVPGVAAVSQAFPNEALDMAVVTITPDSSPSSDQTAQLVQTLRDQAPAFEAAHGFTYEITGQTALAIDISDRLAAAMLPFAIVVVGLSLVLLTIMFRSLAVPITATFGYLLTVGAGLGVATVVFEWGWGASLLGVGKVGPVISFMPILVMAVLFGLAMDYHVFLVSRMRERFVDSGDARASVLDGFSASARVITVAALIMFSVFFSFVPGGNAIIQPIALALAIGVLIDAFVVRMTLIPALMALLGAHAWWLPRWLDALLPDADIEGEAVRRMLDQRAWREADRDVRGDGIHAHEATFGDSAPVTVDLPRAGVLVVHGPEAAAVCAGLAGRLPDIRGDLAVGGRLIPFEREPLSRVSTLVPAIPAPTDASTLAEHVRRLIRLDGGKGDRRARARRAIEIWSDLRADPRVLEQIDVPMSLLDESQRWTLDAAAALACAADVTVLDMRRRPDQAALLESVLRAASSSTTLVLAVDDALVDLAALPAVATSVRREVRVVRALHTASSRGALEPASEVIV